MVTLSAARQSRLGSQLRIDVDVEGAAHSQLWFRFDESLAPSPEAVSDALFPIGLLIAMINGGSFEMASPVSQRLLEQADRIQDILLSWHGSKLNRVQVDVEGRDDAEVTAAPGTAACFTGGVDSFFTLLKHRDEISSLVYVHGFDIPLARQEVYDVTAEHLRTVAAATGKRLIEMATNLKSFLAAVRWGPISHGHALASVAMLLSKDHGKLLIPASHTYADMYPWGTTPLVDPLWSTARVAIVHDGAEATRVQKTVALGESHDAREHLRVCWKNTGAYNCGVCEKCYRTKICLRLAGTLDNFTTFDNSIVDPSIVRKIVIHNASALSFTVENRDFAKEVGDEEIAKALNAAISAYWNRQPRMKRLVSDKKKLMNENKKLTNEKKRLEDDVERLKRTVDKLRARKSLRAADAVGGIVAPLKRKFAELRR